jgi:hypothetical protein
MRAQDCRYLSNGADSLAAQLTPLCGEGHPHTDTPRLPKSHSQRLIVELPTVVFERQVHAVIPEGAANADDRIWNPCGYYRNQLDHDSST